LAAGGLSSSIGNSSGSIAANLTIDGGRLKYTGSGDSTSRQFTIGANGGTLDSSGTGALSFTDSGTSSISFSGSGNRTFTLAGSNVDTNTLAGRIVDPSGAITSFVKSGTGNWIISAPSTFSGTTTVYGGTLTLDNGSSPNVRLTNTSGIVVNSGGTLLLSQSGATASSNRINDSATVTLAGGTFNLGGYSETSAAGTNGIGALTLTATSILDFGTSGTSNLIQFASVGSHTTSTMLNIIDWEGTFGQANGTDRLLFAGITSAFTSSYNQGDVTFDGATGYGIQQFSGFYEVYGLTAVPEPSTWAAAALALCAIAWTERRRFRLQKAEALKM
jgi:fibronectin-binding autotransporter adhesin